MVTRAFSRWQASGIHLLISAAIAAAALYLTLRVWYPPPLFTAEGGNDILLLLVVVDVVIGPLITLVIFKSGKPGLRFDLTVIALLQSAALLYGCHVMFVARPVYIALVDEQFETVRANDLDPADLAQARLAEFRALPLAGPRFVVIEIPRDMNVLKELLANMQKDGKVVQHLPMFYVPYAGHETQALAKSRPVAGIRERDAGLADRMEKLIAAAGKNAAGLNYVPLQTRRGWGTVLLDGQSGKIVMMLPPNL